MKVKYYFDYLSPYAYLVWKRIPTLKQELNLDIEYVPILFAGLLNHWGQKGPAEIPAKCEYVFLECLRHAKEMQIPFGRPKHHPFNPLFSLRLSLIEASGKHQEEVINAIWDAGWRKSLDIGCPDTLKIILEEADLPSKDLLSAIENKDIKLCLKLNTQMAIDEKVFGVPTFVTEDKKIFWGLSALEHLKKYINGEMNIEAKELNSLLNRESSASRK